MPKIQLRLTIKGLFNLPLWQVALLP